jgi:signal transduction histidine kinase
MADPPRVLVVDKSRTDRTLAAKALRGLGLRVTLARSSDAALEQLTRQATDLVLIGLGPNAEQPTELELSAELKRRVGPNVPLLAALQPGENSSQAAYAAGADEVLDKPLSPDVLRARVSAWLRFRGEIDRLTAERDELLRSLADQRELLELLVHDIQNPLTVVEYNLAFADVSRDPDAEANVALREAADAARRVHSQLECAIRIVESEGHGLSLVTQRFKLREVIVDVRAELEHDAATRGSRVTLDVDDELELEGDRHLIGQMLSNLISIVLRHTSGPGRVHVAASALGMAEIRIMSTGIPIHESERARWFERPRVTTAPSSHPRRFGLGLYFARTVATAHGGHVAFEDHAGWANTIVIRLRAGQTAANDAAPATQPSDVGGAIVPGSGKWRTSDPASESRLVAGKTELDEARETAEQED